MPQDTTEKLERRQARFKQRSGKDAGAFKRPGSRNPHKTAPKGDGKRSRSSIQADSRAATRA